MSKDLRSSNVQDLDAQGSASATDLVPAERNGRDVYLTAQQIADLGGGGGAVSSVDSRTGAVTLTDLYDASGAAATAQSNAIAASQPVDSDLTAIAALTTQTFGRARLTDTNAAAAISALGLDADIATFALPASTTISAFGATLTDDADAATARTTIGLGNVDNTADANKPVSTAQQTALNLKANLASPALTGSPTAPTATAQDNSTKLATTAYVDNAIAGLSDKPDVAYASTSALPANTYANGSSGVGATLTGNANGPLLIDGVTLVIGQAGERVLVAAESASANNGWYTITQVGVIAVSPYILTRATESDQAAEIGAGYLTAVTAPNTVTPGSSNNGKLFVSVAADPFTVGTTALTFSQVGSTYSAGTGIGLSGTTFSIDTAVTVDKTTAQTLTNKTLTSPALTTPTGIVASDIASGTFGVARGGTGAATLAAHGIVVGEGTSAVALVGPDSSSTKYLRSAGSSADPSFQAIAESEVTNLTTDLTALQTQTTIQAAQITAQVTANTGFYVGQGLAYSPNGTPTKLDSTAGMGVIGTTDVRIAAQTAISTTIASLADATNPKWVVVEIDTAGATQFNQGTAAASPAVPTFTASRIPVALIFVPANATNVDVLLTTNNGLAKLIGLGSTTATAALGVTRGGPGPTGWQYDQNPWVFASATSFTVTGVDATGYLPVSTKVSWYDGATKYGTVVAVSFSTNTTVTLASTYDYTVANAAITAPRFSYQEAPQGFPTAFNWAPTLVGWSPTPGSAAALTSVTSTIATSLLTKTAHGLANGTPIVLTGIATTTGITNLTTYFVVSTAANTFQVAATVGGAAITFGGTADAAIAVATLLNGFRFWCVGRRCTINIRAANGGTSTNATHSATLPITAATITNPVWTNTGNFTDNNVTQVGRATVSPAGTTVNLVGVLANGNNTNSGTSNLPGVQLEYEF